ncbi:type II toxin-antitoxin system RelE/ParE family toxin [Flammeovirga aprica]|uniref:Type II toxin-antitoxin system RelE/ParE family toxin n=1 Tax=Flammeovirga aprica JL-4 TaxID=694437 RepID=A0A7X9RUQ9_9BACT|nr:type II toxin-antitoxin system RelE/ParE family toxin [Flammeovirga aprica]NME69068.1 type II toxin-antitoxin system RelE/ParE family toxin [Flammeovirga aprica JL-4]
MNYNIAVIPNFKKELKKLAKKYPSLKSDFSKLIQTLEKDPKLGIPLGNNCYKIRLAITSKGKGKSAGARVISYIQITESTVYLLSIFDKSEKESISDKAISELLKYIP